MRKIHLQCRTSLIKLATVARGMHRAGLHISRPSDILDFALDAAQRLFSAPFFSTEEDAEVYLQNAGFSAPAREERKHALLEILSKSKGSQEELEDLIEQVRRGPSSPEEIKEMFNATPMSEVQKVDS